MTPPPQQPYGHNRLFSNPFHPHTRDNAAFSRVARRKNCDSNSARPTNPAVACSRPLPTITRRSLTGSALAGQAMLRMPSGRPGGFVRSILTGRTKFIGVK